MAIGSDAQSYVSGGKSNVADMVRILEGSGVALMNTNRVLEFGCASGRMLRHVPEFAPKAELWGVDISAAYSMVCRQSHAGHALRHHYDDSTSTL